MIGWLKRRRLAVEVADALLRQRASARAYSTHCGNPTYTDYWYDRKYQLRQQLRNATQSLNYELDNYAQRKGTI